MRHGAHALVAIGVVALVTGAVTTTVAGAPRTNATASAYCSGVDVADLRRPYSFRYGLTGDELQSGFFSSSGLGSQGFRPRRLTGYRAGSEQLFATKWVQAPGPEWYARFGLTSSEFGTLFEQRRSAWRPVDVSGYSSPGGALRHAVIWERNVSPRVDWRLHRDVSRAGMQALVDEYTASGFVPVRVEAYPKSGQLRYVSTWVKTACNWRMHNRMTRSEYQSRLDSYVGTYRLVHLDAFVEGGTTYYAGIWWRQPGPGQEVRSDRDWYVFQRFVNSNGCAGRVTDNFYAADVQGGVRYGGIWTAAGAPTLGSLESRVRQEVNCTPARAGAAIFNLTTGQQILVHADASYGTSSTIKSAILYALLRRIDATTATLDTPLAAGRQYGTERGSPLFQSRRSYPLRTFATKMIQSSCNWSTNRLIDYVGMANVNQALRDLGIEDVTLRRYMTGAGAPGARSGSSGPGDDYGDGIDNTATPRAYATFIRLMDQNAGNLSRSSQTFFWSTLGLNSGAHDAILDAGVATNRGATALLAEKAGSNTWSGGPSTKPQLTGTHYQRSVAGRMRVVGGPTIVYALFADEGTASSATPLQNMLDCVVMLAMREYSGRTTGADVAACAAG
jgi:hypothetical protein